jgi:hypothetical protein
LRHRNIALPASDPATDIPQQMKGCPTLQRPLAQFMLV